MYDYLVEHAPSAEVMELAAVLMLIIVFGQVLLPALQRRFMNRQDRVVKKLQKQVDQQTIDEYIRDGLAVAVSDGSLTKEAVDNYLRAPWYRRIHVPRIKFNLKPRSKSQKKYDALIVRRKN